MTGEGIVVVGASAAGISAVREVRTIDPDVPIHVFSREKHLPYYRPLLTEYLADDEVITRSAFLLNPPSWYDEKRIDLRLGDEVTGIDAARRTVKTSDGTEWKYRSLILACGSSPFVPFADVLKKKNVFAIRTLDDARALRERISSSKTAVVIGGGLLGLEAAHSLSRRGLRVTIIEVNTRILPRQLDEECSIILQDIIARNEITLMMGRTVEAIEGGETATGIMLNEGTHVAADLIVFSIGVKPSVELARSAGIETGRAIVVNDRMETSVPGIYACGDAAEFGGAVVALWMPALQQGRIAGSNAAGKEARYRPDILPAMLNSFGTRIVSAGDICLGRGKDEFRFHMEKDASRGRYRKLFFVDDKLVGYILIGDVADSAKLAAAVKNGATYRDMVS